MRFILKAWNPPPPPAGAKAYRLLLALILPILLVGFASEIASPKNIHTTETQLAQATSPTANTKDKDCEAAIKRVIPLQGGSEIYSMPITKSGVADSCIGAHIDKSKVQPNDQEPYNNPKNYKCVGKWVKVIINSKGEISAKWTDFGRVPAGVCSVRYCDEKEKCQPAKNVPAGENLLPLTIPEKRGPGLLEQLYPNKDRNLGPGLLDQDKGLLDQLDQGIDKNFGPGLLDQPSEKKGTPADGLLDQLTQIEGRTQNAGYPAPMGNPLSENLQDARRLGFLGLQMETLNTSAYERIQNIAGGITGFGNTYTPPALNGVSGSQWQQIVFVQNLRTLIF